MNELALAGDEIGELKGPQRGHLRIGVNEVIATDILPDAIAVIHSRHPNLTFKIVVDNTPEIVRRVHDGDVDVGFGYNFPAIKELNFVAVKQILLWGRSPAVSARSRPRPAPPTSRFVAKPAQ